MKTTTDPANWHFYFTVTDLARLLGKSPVTIRGWERKGLVTLPRDRGGDRKLNIDDVRKTAELALSLKRITLQRYYLVVTAMTALKTIEQENLK